MLQTQPANTQVVDADCHLTRNAKVGATVPGSRRQSALLQRQPKLASQSDIVDCDAGRPHAMQEGAIIGARECDIKLALHLPEVVAGQLALHQQGRIQAILNGIEGDSMTPVKTLEVQTGIGEPGDLPGMVMNGQSGLLQLQQRQTFQPFQNPGR